MDVMDLLAIGLTFGVIVIIVMRDIETASHRERERRFDAASAVAGGPTGLVGVDGMIGERETFRGGAAARGTVAAAAFAGVAAERDDADGRGGNGTPVGPDAAGVDDPVDEFPIEAIEASFRVAPDTGFVAADTETGQDHGTDADSAVPGDRDAAEAGASGMAADTGPSAGATDTGYVASGAVVIDEAVADDLAPGVPEGADATGIMLAEDTSADRGEDTDGQEAVSRPAALAPTS